MTDEVAKCDDAGVCTSGGEYRVTFVDGKLKLLVLVFARDGKELQCGVINLSSGSSFFIGSGVK